ERRARRRSPLLVPGPARSVARSPGTPASCVRDGRPRIPRPCGRPAAGTRDPAMDTNANGVDSRVVEAMETHRPALERYVRSMVRDADEAADIVQETHVRLLIAARAGGLPESPGAWM